MQAHITLLYNLPNSFMRSDWTVTHLFKWEIESEVGRGVVFDHKIGTVKCVVFWYKALRTVLLVLGLKELNCFLVWFSRYRSSAFGTQDEGEWQQFQHFSHVPTQMKTAIVLIGRCCVAVSLPPISCLAKCLSKCIEQVEWAVDVGWCACPAQDFYILNTISCVWCKAL